MSLYLGYEKKICVLNKINNSYVLRKGYKQSINETLNGNKMDEKTGNFKRLIWL